MLGLSYRGCPQLTEVAPVRLKLQPNLEDGWWPSLVIAILEQKPGLCIGVRMTL